MLSLQWPSHTLANRAESQSEDFSVLYFAHFCNFFASSLYEDFEQAKKEGMYDSDLKTVARMLLQSKDALSRGTCNLSVQIVGRLGDRGLHWDAKKYENQNMKGGKGDSKKNEGKKDVKKDDKKKKKDSIASLVEQAMNPHITCLVTKQRE